MIITRLERQKAMTAFRKDLSLDVQVITREGKLIGTITRTNRVVQFPRVSRQMEVWA